MTLKSIINIGFFFIILNSVGQNMQEGFNFLESGKYTKAASFFENLIITYPENKTVRLCYGRAIGLNGNSEKAKIVFTELLKDYPKDFEVKLNFGESLLWNSNFIEAKTYYKELVSEKPKNFGALLGYSNTLSNLKEYESALEYVNKALEIFPGNPSALNSKKYIYLGYAYQNQQSQNYTEAEQLLTTNLTLFDDDKDTLLNLANLYLISNQLDNAKIIYNRLGEQSEFKILALNGLALIEHLDGKEKKALNLSSQSYSSLNTQTNDTYVQQTSERYIQALIWNRKYKSAKTLIDKLIIDQPNENWILALSATLNLYKSDFKKSLSDYNKILEKDSTSFDGNLGKANALKALGQYDEAYVFAEKTLKFYNNQKDAVNFINQMDINFAPTLDSKASHTFDNGDNSAFTYRNNVVYPLSTKLSLLGNFNFRTTKNILTKNSATSNNVSLGLSYQLLPNVTFSGAAGLTSAKAESDDYTQFIADVFFNIKPFKLQNLDLGYKRNIQSFNADLIDREIVMDDFFVNYNINTNINLGLFSQYYFTTQSDGNSRNLLFTSLYYNLLHRPYLKVGLNYQYITFKNQVPDIYFSPERFNATEVFFNIIKDEAITKLKEWYYNATAAFGYQFIEDNSGQGTYRFQGVFGYKFSERSFLNLYCTHSNIASATASGFTFTEIGLRFKWRLLDKAVFR
jgi:tetratricopeptide (TPR) repeat protein